MNQSQQERSAVSAIRKLYEGKKASVREVTELYIGRAKKLNPEINSCVTVIDSPDGDIYTAEKLFAEGKASPLTGIPIIIKDNICTKGVLTSCASKMLSDFIPPYNATVIEKLNALGAVKIAKANMDEFAMGGSGETSYYGATRNPYNTDCVPGGSSSGAAAAVSSGICAGALGSDTGGSIRQPAAFCGVTGLKPTYGAVSRYGLVAFASSLDQIGPIANSAEDCGLILNAVAGRDPRDATSLAGTGEDFNRLIGQSLKGKRLALVSELMGEGTDEAVRLAVEKAARFFRENGAIVGTVSLPEINRAIPAYYLIACAEASSNLARFDGIKYGYRASGYADYHELVRKSRMEGFGWEVKRRILLGAYALSSGYYDDYYKKAVYLKNRLKYQYNEIFKAYDAVLAPTAPTVAYKIGEQVNNPVQMYVADICTVTVNLAGLPAISTPCAYGNGLPIGLSIIGRPFSEAVIIQLADAFERSFDWRAPKVWEGCISC
ncbi:MAG: Asp-tRNA(Asn)/Glu-tRNA(Gln) amidotransferase subunit GatA [Oscillospiraceae bacterium]|jgi:aspartyl-tRNA(Asn)/glutamyl-tRNA(Gln) amidotransferase subunit A|nr:Asp-tRNA(Asn)/Glu-tRNA(Gln) amidotransferase subunit GatA [Oscillospiraceae bacterium]